MTQPHRQSATASRPALTLVPPALHRPHRNALALWHLLSLDAPSVAALWTIFVARCAHLSLRWTSPAAMFLAVWMLYAADRLLDARILSAQTDFAARGELEERHLFHHRHRKVYLTVIFAASVGLAFLLPSLEIAALRLYVLLASLLTAYFFLIHIYPANLDPAPRLPKELAVGIFFPAAVFIPTVARVPSLRPALLPAAVLFAAVCTLNCLYLYAWEHPGPRTSAHWTTRFATNHLRTLSLITIFAAALACFAAHLRSEAPVRSGAQHPLTLLSLAVLLSAALLLLLHTQRNRLAAIHLRAAADLALLTPLLLLPFAR